MYKTSSFHPICFWHKYLMIFQSGEQRRHCNTFEKSSTLVKLYFSANSFSSSVPDPSLHNTRDNSKREPNSCVNLCCFTPIKRKITNCSNWNGSSQNDLKLPVSLPLTFMWGPLLTKKVQKKFCNPSNDFPNLYAINKY